MIEIYLIRHGQTDANKNALVQGRKDNPLNQTGIDQAKQTGLFLKKQNINFDICITSPLQRAILTTEIIKNELNLKMPTMIEPKLIERDFGDYDGKKITDNYYDMVRSGSISNMETDNEIETRIKNYFEYFCKEYTNKKVLMVAHSHVIKALLVNHINDFNYKTILNNCSINKLTCSNSKLKVIDYNINPL
ncbi:MAG: histidine phosphatase family protein [Candidatus Izimaplasma sp.]|nr:histidine phosphatase family protein [Candidatus Izimaplasma bacterium]